MISLLQREAPGWLYSVLQGATTIRRTGMPTARNGSRKDSFNHYSYGAIAGWLMDCVERYPGGGRQTADPSLSRPAAGVREGNLRLAAGKGSAPDGSTHRMASGSPLSSHQTARAVVTLPDGERELEPGGSIPFFFLMRWNEFQRCYRGVFQAENIVG